MSTALTTPTKNTDVRDLLRSDKILEQCRLALPAHLTPERMVRVMCTSMLRNPKLLDCRQESLVEALMICSQAGIEPDGRNAHLIPYGDKVQVIFDYKGLVAIAERNGVESIYADKVCDNDQFEAFVEEGAKKLKHKVDWRKPRGNAYAYYASCIRNNRLDYEVMTKDEVDAIRKRSKASGSGPWVTDYDEMAKKTVLRRMSKRWDLSPEARDAITSDADVPDFEVSVPEVKTPQFPEPPPMLTPPTPAATRKRRTNIDNIAPAEPAPKPDDGDLAPQPVAAPEKSFEEIVDGAPPTEQPNPLGKLQAAIAAAKIDDNYAIAEAKVVNFFAAHNLLQEGQPKVLRSVIPGKIESIIKMLPQMGVQINAAAQ